MSDVASDKNEDEGDDMSKRGSEADQGEEDPDDDDEYAFRVYFRKEEIQIATEQQQKD